VTGRARGVTLPRAIDSVLRELVNALSKAAMYPSGHRFITESSAVLIERLRDAMVDRDSVTIGILPRGLLLDGTAVEPLPAMLRDFAVRLHRKNIGTIHITRGISPAEVTSLISGLSSSNAEETVGRGGLRLEHARVEPMVYDVLAFADPTADRELDDVFWMALVEAAFGQRLHDGDAVPTAAQIAEAITLRATESPEGAQRVYEALAGFSGALASRGEQATRTARRRFVEVLSALSQPATTRVVAAAASSTSRRRFLRDTLQVVPPALLLQLLESVAEADGEPISPQLRWLLGKLAGGEGAGEPVGTDAFTDEVLGLVQQWDLVVYDADEEADPRLGIEPARVLAIGLELELAAPRVVDAARRLADRGQLIEALQLVDDPQNEARVARTIADAILDPGLLPMLLSRPELDFRLIERVAHHAGSAAAGPLLDALSAASERATRRRLLDILGGIGAAAEETLLGRLDGAPWYLARNILTVMGQLPALQNVEPVFTALSQPELRVRQEALKVLLRQPGARDRAVTEALESGEESLSRMALTALGTECPPRLVGAILRALASPSQDLQLQALRALGTTSSPLVVPHLLTLVRTRGGIFRRTRLLPKSRVTLAALELLARRWSNHRPVLSLMQLAAKSGDADIRAVVGDKR
jgi:HEAT repeat protein